MTDTAARAPLSAEGRATALILSAMVMFTLQDLVTKLVSDSASLWQLQLVRSGLVVLIVLAVAQVSGARLRLARYRWALVRSCFMCLSYLLFYTALPLLTISATASAFFTGPLFITLFARVFLGDPLGPRRVVAVLVGFAGVLVIVRPGAADVQLEALLPVASAACYAAGITITRARCKDEPVLGLTLVHNLLYSSIALVGLAVVPLLPWGAEFAVKWHFLATGWHPLELWAAGLLGLTALTHVCGIVMATRAYQMAEPGRIAPLEYTYLIYAPVWDVLFWGKVPPATTFLGMGLIAAAGVFVAWRTGTPARPRVPADGE